MSILRLPLALCLNFAVAAGVADPADSQISEQPIKVGVITDMNGPLASATGRGSVEAARMAAEEFGFSISGRPVEILSADHQNKPDMGAPSCVDGSMSSTSMPSQISPIPRSDSPSWRSRAPATRSSWSAPDPRTLPGRLRNGHALVQNSRS
jgi:hypothetical protein